MSRGERFKAVRAKFGLTATEMAVKVGLSDRSSWERYERGKHIPSGDVLLHLSDMNVDINWLLTGDGHMLKEADAGVPTEAALQARLAEIESLLDQEQDMPISPATRRDRPDLDAMHQELLHMARRTDTPKATARADLLLKVAFGDRAAWARVEQRGKEFAQELRQATSAFDQAVQQADWQPPTHIAMLMRDLMIIHNVPQEDIATLLAAIKRDLIDGKTQ